MNVDGLLCHGCLLSVSFFVILSTLKDALGDHALETKEYIEHTNISKHVILLVAVAAMWIRGLVVLDRINLADKCHQLLTACTTGCLVSLNPVGLSTELAAPPEGFVPVMRPERMFPMWDALK